MANLIDFRSLKAAGVYTMEIDNTEEPRIDVSTFRLLVGFNPTGPFNVPVYISNDEERRGVYGDIDRKLENRGCYFNRSLQTMLFAGPVLALNLFRPTENDWVGLVNMSLDSASMNPAATVMPQDAGFGTLDGSKYTRKLRMPKSYYKYDDPQMADTEDDLVKENEFIGATQFTSLYDRSRFWKPSPENLTRASGVSNGTGDNIDQAPLFAFSNAGTKDLSILVFKPENLLGYSVTAREWYGSEQNIPYGWIRPTDYISDYFIQVVAVEGVWSDFESYAVDPYWENFFTKDGIRKDKLNQFMGLEGVKVVGSWIGSIIPHFKDKTGGVEYIQTKINNATPITGLMCSINESALESLVYSRNDEGLGVWTRDYNEVGGTKDVYNIDLVGHNLVMNDEDKNDVRFLSYVHSEEKDALRKIEEYSLTDIERGLRNTYGTDLIKTYFRFTTPGASNEFEFNLPNAEIFDTDQTFVVEQPGSTIQKNEIAFKHLEDNISDAKETQKQIKTITSKDKTLDGSIEKVKEDLRLVKMENEKNETERKTKLDEDFFIGTTAQEKLTAYNAFLALVDAVVTKYPKEDPQVTVNVEKEFPELVSELNAFLKKDKKFDVDATPSDDILGRINEAVRDARKVLEKDDEIKVLNENLKALNTKLKNIGTPSSLEDKKALVESIYSKASSLFNSQSISDVFGIGDFVHNVLYLAKSGEDDDKIKKYADYVIPGITRITKIRTVSGAQLKLLKANLGQPSADQAV